MDLVIQVKKPTFEKIKAGELLELKRPWTRYWRNRLYGRLYDRVVVECNGQQLRYRWFGYSQGLITLGKRSRWGFIIAINAYKSNP